ncbi:MAG: putative glycoside hydrolase [Patescibacteria group bacterium]|nr:putative glycoside hydrolase [Patescibacteria group bacterium]MDD4610956.1 putative glycoside hydrolase [Patescibacteria group bacterium]
MLKKIFKTLAVVFLLSQLFLPSRVQASEEYPRLANYYLKFFDKKDYEDLYKWDLIITPAEMVYKNSDFFKEYRQRNKEGMLFAYVYPAMVNVYDVNEPTGLIPYVYNNIEKNNWWLRGGNGEKLEMWPYVYVVNAAREEWRNFNVDYINSKIKLEQWDGVFYDIVDAEISHYSKQGTGIDINSDGKSETQNYVNQEWQKGMAELFRKTREKTSSDKKILINGNSISAYQPDVNGRMLETFPTPWEGNGTWEASMNSYLKILPAQNENPQIYVINSNTNNTGAQNDYKKMRYGLSSALLGDGYFSFDYGDQSHAQTWWYDEYNVNLGKAISAPYNLLDKNNSTIKPGLWRRDFANGIAIVNSTKEEQNYLFSKEEFEKINGIQDRSVNNGAKINYIKIAPSDGVILLKIKNEVLDSSFDNGSFVRVFNKIGAQVKNGFFAYLNNYSGDTQIVLTDIDNDSVKETVVNGGGSLSIYKNGKKTKEFWPYSDKFKKKVSFVVTDMNNDGTKEIITGTGAGGGPQVRIFNKDGKLLSGGFFAYDKNFRGGVNIAVSDINGDGQKEIVTAPGKGGEPQIKVFNEKGKLLSGGFLAYSKTFRGGASVAVGDVDGDGAKEIITGAGAGGGPHVRIFNRNGKLESQFFAYSQNMRSGINVIANDIDKNGVEEVLVETVSF